MLLPLRAIVVVLILPAAVLGSPAGPPLRKLAAALRPPLLIGTDLVDSCPCPATGAPAGT